MAIRMTGLTSGLDTESIVASLMEAHKAKKTKVENNKTKLEWKKDIWTSLNKKLYSFYTDFAGKMRFQANYMTKKASSSNSSKVTATAGTSAATGSYSVKVNKLAAAQSVTSAKLGTYQVTETDKDGNSKLVEKKITGSTKLSDLGMTADGSSQIEIKAGNKNVSLIVNENTTVNDFMQSLKDAGLNVTLDEKQGRFFISSKESGKDQSFSIMTKQLNLNQNIALTDVKNAVDFTNLSASQQNTVTQALAKLQDSKSDNKVATAVKTIEDMLDAREKSISTKKYRGELTDSYSDKYIKRELKKDDDGNVVKDEDGNDVYVETLTEEGIQALKDAKKYTETEINDTWVQDDIDAAKKSDESKNLKAVKDLIKTQVEKDLKTDEYKEKIEKDVQDAKTARGTSVLDTVTNYATSVSGGIATGDGSELSKLGLGNIDGSEVKEASAGQGMVVIAAEDSEIEFNGATLTGSSTTMEVNGITLNLTGKTDEAVMISVTNDTQGVYDTIKEFVNQYNSILADLNKYYNASSARGYDPLTDEQKDAMSDTEVEKWETKIKDSLLRRDSTLNGLISTLRTTMTATTIKASNGKTYSLANLGITTGKDYKEYGLLHIKGDEDDTDYADSTNTLMDLLNEDPSVVTEVLSGITTKLYNNLQKKMASSSLSSALTFYNDKEINKQLSTYDKDIKKWETKLSDMENRYYKQFTAMEKALASLQSQQSSLAGFLGM
ncbi:MAG: flagellar filament capping protein FliD [Lachnospiraceae bacterium]|nr:flagellar filament capping protein FliD [Lachnospiraceae bacterium]